MKKLILICTAVFLFTACEKDLLMILKMKQKTRKLQ